MRNESFEILLLWSFFFFGNFSELERFLNLRDMLNIDNSIEYNSSKQHFCLECYRENYVFSFSISRNPVLLSY